MEDRTKVAVREGRIKQAMSRSAISDYEHGRKLERPGPDRVAALAAALDCSFAEVAAAVEETWQLAATPVAEPWYVTRFRALTDGRSEAERGELLLIMEQVLRMRDLDGTNGRD